MIVYNETESPIVICTKWTADPNGGPAIQETTHIIMPGDGIDLSVVGLFQRSTPPPAAVSEEEIERLAKERVKLTNIPDGYGKMKWCFGFMEGYGSGHCDGFIKGEERQRTIAAALSARQWPSEDEIKAFMLKQSFVGDPVITATIDWLKARMERK